MWNDVNLWFETKVCTKLTVLLRRKFETKVLSQNTLNLSNPISNQMTILHLECQDEKYKPYFRQ